MVGFAAGGGVLVAEQEAAKQAAKANIATLRLDMLSPLTALSDIHRQAPRLRPRIVSLEVFGAYRDSGCLMPVEATFYEFALMFYGFGSPHAD